MKLVLKRARGAFLNLFEPKRVNDQGEARCGGSFIFDPKDPQGKANLDALLHTINTVATEKWGIKAQQELMTLKAGGKLCLRDGATKANYDGFAGNLFVTASNKGRIAVIAARKFNGKPVALDPMGRTYIDGVLTDVGFECKVPYSGSYVNASLDVWVQQNSFGKRVNAKLLAVQYAAEGAAFSGGEGFDDADFDDLGGDDGASDGFFGAAAQPQSGGFFNFGASPPAVASNDFFVTAAPAGNSWGF